MNTRVIRLLGDKGFTLVDVDVFDAVRSKTWSLHTNGYVSRKEWNPTTKRCSHIYLHRVVNCTPPGMQTDHINGNKRDNTRSNLRSCTRFQNMRNQKLQTREKSSRFKGVCWDKQHGKWIVGIKTHGVRKHIGLFADEVEAARAYNSKATELFGEFAGLNRI